MSIHPSSIIAPGAHIDHDVEIGPFCVIGPHVSIGKGTKIGVATVIEGYTSIGEYNHIGHHSVIGGRPQDMKYQDEPTQLVIGHRNTIREYVTIHTGTTQAQGITRVGDDNWIMSYVHIAHDCEVHNHTILSSNAQLAGHVVVEDYAIIGGMSGVHQFVRIGQHALLGGASSLVQDIPAYVMAAGQKAAPHGINQVGLSRRNFSDIQISALKRAYKIVYREDLLLEEAKKNLASDIESADINTQHVLRIFLQSLHNSQRGIVR